MAPAGCRARSLPRAVALLTGCLAALTGANAWGPTSAGRPDVVAWLAAAVALVAATAAVRLWQRDRFEARLVAGLVSATTLAGQLLVWFVGLPGNRSPHLSLTGAAVAALSTSILLILAADARREDAPRSGRPPYAL